MNTNELCCGCLVTSLLLCLQRMCWHHSVLRGLMLLWAGSCLTIAAFVFTLLVVFHTYLATTNQTTYEMTKSQFRSTLQLLNCPVCLDSIVKLHEYQSRACIHAQNVHNLRALSPHVANSQLLPFFCRLLSEIGAVVPPPLYK